MNKLKIEKYRKKPLGFDNELCVEKIYTELLELELFD